MFELVSETVAVLSNLDREFWRHWGNSLGILFQWMDDWQDREEDTLQKNRNAFNEQFDLTLKYYNYLYK
jgi:geranylgeranyl pyrophosphate synthase